TIERDGEDEDGKVVKVELADETGRIRCAFWDELAESAASDLETGTVMRFQGRPKEGFNGVEVNIDRAEIDEEAEIDVPSNEDLRIEDLSLGLSDVTLQGLVLGTEPIRTFDRDDGSEGRVSNLVLGDETGRLRVTLWDERADLAEAFDAGQSVEVVDGYVRERDGDLELHVGNRGTIDAIDADIEYVPDATDIADLAIDQTVDIAGVVRSADPKRTFDRDDGSEGQVKNIRVQDKTGDIRVALWGEKADVEVAPGDRVQLADVEIRDGWQDELEASAGWRSTVTVIADDASGDEPDDSGSSAGEAGLSDFADADATPADGEDDTTAVHEAGADAVDEADEDGLPEDEPIEFTGVVVQAGEPVVLDDGTETLAVETDASVTLGEEITVRGTVRDGRLTPDEIL
ncbi:MAG: single-stranded DNA binding protein, partial [Halobacteriales archaeon]|nr:single-stranded DNA binding protein [Halobacteriales archaeon]